MAVVIGELEPHLNPKSRAPSSRAVAVLHWIRQCAARSEVIRAERVNDLISAVANRGGFCVGAAVRISSTSAGLPADQINGIDTPSDVRHLLNEHASVKCPLLGWCCGRARCGGIRDRPSAAVWQKRDPYVGFLGVGLAPGNHEGGVRDRQNQYEQQHLPGGPLRLNGWLCLGRNCLGRNCTRCRRCSRTRWRGWGLARLNRATSSGAARCARQHVKCKLPGTRERTDLSNRCLDLQLHALSAVLRRSASGIA